MSEYNTGNLVPSMDPRDLDDNTTVFDELLNSTEDFVPDRLGESRKTWHRMELDAEALIAPNVSSLAAVVGAANKGLYFTGAETLAPYDLSALARSFSAATTQTAARGVILAMALTDTGAYAGSSAKLTTARGITATGDGSWTVSFDGSAAVSSAFTLAASGVGAGTYGSVTVNTKGLVTSATVATPIANGGTGQTTQAAALTALLDVSVIPEANGGTGVAAQSFTSLTLSNSWEVIPTRRAGYRKITSDLVYLEIQIQNGTSTDDTAICTALPAGFRPPNSLAIPVQSGPNTTPSPSVSGPRVVVGTDGSIICRNCSSAPGISFTATFSTT